MSNSLQKKYTTFFKSIDEHGKSTIDESYLDIKLQFKDTDQIEFLNFDEYDKLIQVKNKIDNLDDCKLWDKTKKISNDFELIYLPNKKMKSNSISKYEPLSRSYFKLWEIIQDFNLINVNEKIKVAGLAEGPGGFIEAIINYRKKFKNTCKQDEIYGITLKSSDKDIPGWTKAGNFLKKNENVKISYGSDGTGNIYNIDNIKEFSKLFKRDADLVTADGGFDFSTNFNKQEQTSLRIIFCEIVTALSIQKKGGSFICKVYDTYTHVSISFLFILHCLYNSVNIIKPFTSRPANSEKYLVCNGFKGITDNLLKKLYIIVKTWDYIDNNDFVIYNVLNSICIPDIFINMVKLYNTNYFNHQVNNIEKTLRFITNFQNNPNYEDTDLFKNTLKRQIILAFKWCKRYRCKINYESDYINKKNIENLNNCIIEDSENLDDNSFIKVNKKIKRNNYIKVI